MIFFIFGERIHLARWQTDTLEKEPDVLSVLVGVNDCVRESKKQSPDLSAAEYEEYYRKILTQSREKNPNIKTQLKSADLKDSAPPTVIIPPIRIITIKASIERSIIFTLNILLPLRSLTI